MKKSKGTIAIKPLIPVLIFALTYFVYTDYGIHIRLGLALLVFTFFLSVLSIYSQDDAVLLNNIQLSYTFLSGVIILFSVLPNARLGYDLFALLISIGLSAVFVIISRSALPEINLAMKIIIGTAIAFSLYVVAVAINPDLFYTFFSKGLTTTSKEFAYRMLSGGYGIFVGSSPVFIAYIVTIALFIVVSYIALSQQQNLRYYLLAFVFLFALLLENRKTEMLAAVIVSVFLFFSRINYVSRKKERQKHGLLLCAAPVMMLLIVLLASRGYFDRYIKFIERLGTKGADSDITSGRLYLWKKAIDLFFEKPIFGIGWGNFANHVGSIGHGMEGYVSNAHNNYLQLLCETGIVGFSLVVGLMLVLLVKTVRCSKLIIQNDCDNIGLRVIVSTALGFQLFTMIVNCLDPIIYKMIFWWFYAISIDMVSFAFKTVNKHSS